MMPRFLLVMFLFVTLAMGGAGCKSNGHAKQEATESRTHAAHGDSAEGSHGGEAHDEGNDGHDDEEKNIVTLNPDAAARIQIRTATVEERTLSGVIRTTGRVDFDQDLLAHVSPRVAGRIHRVFATLGDKVKAGQTLAIIDSIQLGRAKSHFLRAKAQLELARATLDREEKLFEDHITSEQSVLEARAALQRALAEYRTTRQELKLLGLSDAEIDSVNYDDPESAMFPLVTPISGTVIEKHVSLGEVVSPERNLYTIADLSRLWIWIDVYERDLERVHLEDDVVVEVTAYPGRIFEGKVAYIRDEIDQDTRTARARIDVANPERLLRAGMFAKVTVTDPHGARGGRMKPTLVVPSEALQRDGERYVAFVPLGENRYERRIVTPGRQAGAYTEVLSGLSAGEPVVVEGTFYLKSEVARHQMGGGHSH